MRSVICTLLLATLFISFALSIQIPAESSMPVVAKHSFRSPFLFGVSSNIPHWEYGGSAVATENFVRLVPAIRSRIGWMWNTEPVETSNWEVTLEFNVHNTHSPGADGMAFWYAKEPRKTGSLFGYAEDFDGVGIIIDSYDNNGNGDNPSIIAVHNNGHHQSWDYEHDLQANQLDRCKADIRNPVNGNAKLRMIYQHNSLQVLVDAHGSNNFAFCFAVENLKLAKGYHFGITAMTGGLADYHDVYSLQMKDLEEKQGPIPHEEPIRRRGWYDPYQHNAHQEPPAPTQNQNQQNQQQQQQPAAAVHEEQDDHAFFESLRAKLKKFGIDDQQQQEQQQEQQQQQEPQKEEGEKREFRRRVRNLQDERNRQNVERFTKDEQEDDAQVQNKASSSSTASHPTDQGLTQSTGLLIIEALEQVEKTVRASSTKQDIVSILNRVTDIADKQQGVQNGMNDLRDHIKTEVNSMLGNLKQETKQLSDEIKRLDTMLNTLYVQLDHVQSAQGKFEKEMERTTDDVKQTIKKESSVGFWTFFVLFQIVFTAGVIYWRKYRDAKDIKLY